MSNLRILTESGKNHFIEYLQKIKHGEDEPPPVTRLSKEPWSTELSPSIEINKEVPMTRLELGEYLTGLFESNGLSRRELIENTGMWSWLALYWFDHICPPEKNGYRHTREIARYVCSSEWRNYFRHLIAASWDIYFLYGESSRLFLWCRLHIHNDFMEQLASRQDTITNKTIIETVDKLYWDAGRKRPKVNATNRKVAGNLRRLLALANQFRLTYDLHTMSADDIIKLLPPEFDVWK